MKTKAPLYHGIEITGIYPICWLYFILNKLSAVWSVAFVTVNILIRSPLKLLLGSKLSKNILFHFESDIADCVIQEVALYLDYRLDESYTPRQISIRAGNSFSDMSEIHAQDLEEPQGWTRIALKTTNSLQGARQRRFRPVTVNIASFLAEMSVSSPRKSSNFVI